MSAAIRPHSVEDGARFTGAASFIIVSCYSCGIPYGIPEGLYNSAKRWRGDRPDGWRLHCPLGHEWFFVGETDVDRARRERDWAREDRTRLRQQLERTEASLRGQTAAKTRFKNERNQLRQRAAAGVCPCCNRTFQNLARHMTGQHPDFTEQR